MGFFKKGANKLESMKTKYAKAETNVNKNRGNSGKTSDSAYERRSDYG